MPAPAYQLGSLAALGLDGLVDLVNQAYVGYPGPFSLEDPLSYAEFCRVQNIDMARSVLAADEDGTPIGFGLLGIRQERGWCAEFGVVPAWRRRGLGRALLDRLLAEAREAGLHDVHLEVAAANTPAQALYQQAGFRVARILHNYVASSATLPTPPVGESARLTLATVDPATLAMDLGLPADVAPAWDHELPALLVGSHARTMLALREGQPVGLIHYQPDPVDVEIRRLAVQPDDHAAALALLAVAAPRAATRLLVAYVAEASPLAALLPALGFRELDPDLEMICPL
jgi:ribosomal protein S18 acetylase RimI-like enzyme